MLDFGALRRLLSFCLPLWITFRLSVHGLWIHDSNFDDLLPASNSPMPSVTVRFKGHCALLCKRDSTCKGFFYNEDNKECMTTSSVFLRNGGELSSTGSRYYRSTPVTCPSDGEYVLHEQSGTCFQLNDVAMNWTDARDSCSAAHGSLASLDTLDKEETLIEYLRAGHSSSNNFCLGGHRPYSAWNTTWPNGQPDFVWLSGQPVDYTGAYWFGPDPNNHGETENVFIVHAMLGWYLADYVEWDFCFSLCEFALF